MRKYAILKNQVVSEIVILEDEQVSDFAKTVEQLIDVEDSEFLVTVGCVLNGNKLEIPQNLSTREQFEIDLNDKKSRFGSEVAREAVNRIGARNKILNKSGAQVTTLLSALINVKILLETGALGTARAICSQLSLVYTEYTDIFEYVVIQVNQFELAHGL